ncbi:hypothetical protein TFLX_06425 [Thermoflexales bacterium]|nr:hypothetical protein TFLX_06425 [Thermoflexales bacterium]
MFLRRWKILIAILIVASGSMLVRLAQAQTNDDAWLSPTNLSHSGAASQPVIATTADGVLHALWWDTTLGTLYARTTSTSESTWIEPSPVPNIVGRRILDTQTGIETIIAPRDLQLFAEATGNIYAFWYDSNDQLYSLLNDGRGWSQPTVVAEKALLFEATSDPSNQLHVVYIRPIDSVEAPAGIYYRSARDGNWSAPRLVASSAYYRTLKPEQVHVSVAGDEVGNVLVAWDAPPLNQSVFARSPDRGATWSEPQSVTGAAAGQARHARFAFGPGNEFLLHWQDASASGCGMTQSRSSDAGQTWTAPEMILSTLTRCDVSWSFTTDQAGRLWLISHVASPATNVVTLAVWDGQTWSEVRDVSFAFFDDRTQLSTNLSCLQLSIAGGTAGLIGCDAGGDVWAARNALALDQWLPNLTRVWRQPQVLSAASGTLTLDGVPDVTADIQGHVYAVWSQATLDGLGTDLYTAAWREDRWSGASRLSPASASGADDTVSTVHQANQPAITADNRDRVHVVWSGGAAGEIFYSWAYARDLGGGQRWNEATRLSPASALGQWPDIVADPRTSSLYVIYALPFNEQRGIYLSLSADVGQAWQPPIKIFDAAAAGWASVDGVRLALDAENKILHAVWLRRTLPGQPQSQEVYYASSRDGGKTWTTPVKIAAGAVVGPQVIVPAPGQVYLAWCQADGVGPNIRGQFSPDGGQRWTAPIPLNQLEQVSCPISLATDGLGQMHLAGITSNAGDESVLLTASWNGQAWAASEVHELGQRTNPANSAVIALVPQADRLSAVIKLWSHQVAAADRFEIVVTDRPVPAVGVLQPLPTFTPRPTPTATPLGTVVPTATPKPQLNDRALRPPTASGGPPPLVLGGALAAIIVVIVVVRIIWVKRR